MKSVVYTIWLARDRFDNSITHVSLPLIGITTWAHIWNVIYVNNYDNHLTF